MKVYIEKSYIKKIVRVIAVKNKIILNFLLRYFINIKFRVVNVIKSKYKIQSNFIT